MKASGLRESGIRGLLLVGGLVASGIAGAILLALDAFYAANGTELGGNASLTNELKAPAGPLLIAGLLMAAWSGPQSLNSASERSA